MTGKLCCMLFIQVESFKVTPRTTIRTTLYTQHQHQHQHQQLSWELCQIHNTSAGVQADPFLTHTLPFETLYYFPLKNTRILSFLIFFLWKLQLSELWIVLSRWIYLIKEKVKVDFDANYVLYLRRSLIWIHQILI